MPVFTKAIFLTSITLLSTAQIRMIVPITNQFVIYVSEIHYLIESIEVSHLFVVWGESMVEGVRYGRKAARGAVSRALLSSRVSAALTYRVSAGCFRVVRP